MTSIRPETESMRGGPRPDVRRLDPSQCQGADGRRGGRGRRGRGILVLRALAADPGRERRKGAHDGQAVHGGRQIAAGAERPAERVFAVRLDVGRRRGGDAPGADGLRRRQVSGRDHAAREGRRARARPSASSRRFGAWKATDTRRWESWRMRPSSTSAAADATSYETEKAYQRAKAARAYQAAGDTAKARQIWTSLEKDPKAPSMAPRRGCGLGELTAQWRRSRSTQVERSRWRYSAIDARPHRSATKAPAAVGAVFRRRSMLVRIRCIM